MGSSPLTRGKLGVGVGVDQVGGLIPAHAGKTARPMGRTRRPRAHPRSRGENMHFALLLTKLSGSSPLTRGKHRADARRPVRSGLIPAHAGKTTFIAVGQALGRAHPRSRGENLSTTVIPGVANGSSPLTRGKRTAACGVPSREGLIPAHAGKTPTPRQSPPCSWAHPRSRGENRGDHPHRRREKGSSPLTRGKRVPPQWHGEAEGLIPAHAGKTCARGSGGAAAGAHPRSRGENS